MRPLAIELAFDPVSDQRLSELWVRLSALYGGPTDSELGVRPHVTLALFRDAEPADIVGVAESLASELKYFPLNLATVDRFPTGEGVVFLRPEGSADLARAHTLVHNLLAEEADLVHAYYRPGAWHPHCTMASNVPETLVGSVMSACGAAEALGEVVVTRAQVVRYRPATEVWGGLLE
jgi:2'-5' RNA ligase